MGTLSSIPQPRFEIDALGWKYRVRVDDPERGFQKGEVVVPVSYRVNHGMSSQTADNMNLLTEDGKKLPVRIWDSDPHEAYYFVANDYPEYDALKYKDNTYQVTLQFTDRLECID